MVIIRIRDRLRVGVKVGTQLGLGLWFETSFWLVLGFGTDLR